MQTDRMNTMILLAEICSAQRRLITVSDTLKADMARRISTEWQKLADEAIQHKVAALVLRQIRELRISAPDGLINKLKAKAANDSAVRMLLLKEWRALTEIFEKKGITCITVKGPASSIQLYGDAVEREYTDLDLFVDAADLESLVPVMSEAGYSVYADDQIVRVPRIFNFIYASEKHVKFKHNRLPIDVEIHNRLWNYDRQLFRTPNAELFADAVYVEFENRKYRTLCPIDHALYQIAHGACHGWCLIHWLLDAAVILTSSDKSFCEELASRAEDLDMDRMLCAVCILTEKIFEADVSPAFNKIRDRHRHAVASSVEYCRQLLITGGRDSKTFNKTAAHIARHLSVNVKSLRVRINLYLRHLKVSNSEISYLRLPSVLFPLYLILRPFLIIQRRINRYLQKKRGAVQ